MNVGLVACRLTGCRLRGIGLVTVGSLNVGSVTGTRSTGSPLLLFHLQLSIVPRVCYPILELFWFLTFLYPGELTTGSFSFGLSFVFEHSADLCCRVFNVHTIDHYCINLLYIYEVIIP